MIALIFVISAGLLIALFGVVGCVFKSVMAARRERRELAEWKGRHADENE